MLVSATADWGYAIAFSQCVNTPIPAGFYYISFAYNAITSGVAEASFGATYYTSANCTIPPGTSAPGVVLEDATITSGSFETVSGTRYVPEGTQSIAFDVMVTCATGVACSAVFDDLSFVSQATAVTFRGLSATGTPKGIEVRWRTASEADTIGFNVYREVNGRRVRVNAKLIASKGRGSYSFLDRRAPRGKAIRYWIQEVAIDGTRRWYGPARVART